MDFQKIADINLIKGAGGGDPRSGLCIMEMVSWFDGANTVTDHPSCACPVLTAIAIRVNDNAPSQEERNTLKPLLPLLSGSRDPENEKARVWFVMRELALRGVATRCDQIGKPHLAKALRDAGDPAALNAAMKMARDELRAYASAYASADAYAYASADADAYAYASAYAYAYADASAYAYADAYADAYASAKKQGATAFEAFRAERRLALWRLTRDVLTEAIYLGKHGGLDVAAPATQARAGELMTLLFA